MVSQMSAIETILFISSDQPTIDRGWDHKDVSFCLSELGFTVETIFAHNTLDILSYMGDCRKSILVWPVCFTLGKDPNGTLLVKFLEDLKIPFVGPSSRALLLSSKLSMKEALRNGPVSSPRFVPLINGVISELPFKFPCVLKCDYTCDSRGVEIVESYEQLREKKNDMVLKFGQRVFAEEWARKKEYTVSYIPDYPCPLLATLELAVDGDVPFVDSSMKQDNGLIRFIVPSPEDVKRLESAAIELAQYLNIDGHFRVDILEDADGKLQIIDINFLPQMHFDLNALSYFPMSFQMQHGLSSLEVVCAILLGLSRTRRIGFSPNIAAAITETTKEPVLRL